MYFQQNLLNVRNTIHSVLPVHASFSDLCFLQGHSSGTGLNWDLIKFRFCVTATYTKKIMHIRHSVALTCVLEMVIFCLDKTVNVWIITLVMFIAVQWPDIIVLMEMAEAWQELWHFLGCCWCKIISVGWFMSVSLSVTLTHCKGYRSAQKVHLFILNASHLNICTVFCVFFFSLSRLCVCSFAGWLVGCLPVSSMHKCTHETSSSLATFSFEQIMWWLHAVVVRAVQYLWWREL